MIELVSQPDLSNPQQVKIYCLKKHLEFDSRMDKVLNMFGMASNIRRKPVNVIKTYERNQAGVRFMYTT